MQGPDWYRRWRREALEELQEKAARLSAEFGLGHWPRYDYDLDAGLLTFSEAGVAKVVAEIQIAGTTSAKAGDWLWAWANDHWPPERVQHAQQVRAFGEQHRIGELVSAVVTDGGDLNALGWTLTAVAARVTGALGAYRPPGAGDGALYLLCTGMAWTS